MDKEKLIIDIMADLECTREEAEEVAEMELKAKDVKRYEKSAEPKERKPRKRKVDETKVHLVKMFYTLLGGMGKTDNVENVVIANEQKEITFSIGSDNYSLTLTKHKK